MALGALMMTVTAIYLIFHLQEVDQRIQDLNGKTEKLLEESAILTAKLGNVTSALALRQGMLQKAIEANNIKEPSLQTSKQPHIDSIRIEIEQTKHILASTEAQIQKSRQVVNEAREQIAALQSDRSRAIILGKVFLIAGLMLCLLGLTAVALPKAKV